MNRTRKNQINTAGLRLLAFVRSLSTADRAEAAALTANHAPVCVVQDWVEERGQPRRMARKLHWALCATADPTP